jgi:hypothetical protein
MSMLIHDRFWLNRWRFEGTKIADVQGGTFSMPPVSWFVPCVAVATLLLAVAWPAVAWFVLTRRQARSEQSVERRFADLTHQSRALEARLERFFEEFGKTPAREGELEHAQMSRPRWSGPSWPTTRAQQRRNPATTWVDGAEPPLIVVPNLAAAANDREVVVNGLTQRYAAIWSLAASGSSAEVIARATGQPIGQIELILGLRRQIDGTRTKIPHAPHS